MKTKTFITVMLFSSIAYSAFAQFEKQNQNTYGISASLNDAHSQIAFPAGAGLDAEGNIIDGGKKTNKSYSLSFTPKYYINNEWLIRFEYGITKIDLRNYNIWHSSVAGSYSEYSIMFDTIELKINRFVPGLQFNFFSSKKIESYGGVNLQYINYSAIKRHRYVEHRDIDTDTLNLWERSWITIPGGYAAGFGVFAGFNVFVHKHLSLGAEFSTALLRFEVGGNSSSGNTYIDLRSPNPTITTTTYTAYESYTGTRFTKVLASFNLTFWF